MVRDPPEARSQPAPPTDGDLRRQLSLVDAVAIFVGIILGSGIFVAPSAVAAAARTPTEAALIWLVGAAVAASGALCYAECGARLPHAGGFFVFYGRAYGEAMAFVAGWAALVITYPASMAAIAHVCAAYATELWSGLSRGHVLIAALAVLLAGALNARGVRLGAWSQRFLTSIKVTALVLLCAAAVWSAPADASAGGPSGAPPPASALAALLSAVVVVLWTYDGWSDVTLVSGEIREPQRNLGRAVLIGVVLLVSVYTAVQLSVFALLPREVAAGSQRVLSEATAAGLGPGSGRLVAALVMVSTFGAINAVTLTASRVGFAMARAGALPRWLGALHPVFGTPRRSVAVLSATALAYTLVADFQSLLGLFTFAVWFFYALTAVALLRLRHLRVGEPLPWRAPLGLLPPLVIVAVAAYMTVSLYLEAPGRSTAGLGLLLAGFAIHAVQRRVRGGGDVPRG